jgi:predicted NAD-dependent protein-ADP-ribosyltransferase YbiA (DUF1768 family)
MVKSKLDDSIEYFEQKKIDKDDVNYDATMYEIILQKHKVIIALGKPKYTYIDKNIEFYPIYLVKKNKVTSQIGLYEIISTTLPDILDADGDINLESLYDPLLYTFVQKDSSIIENASLGIVKDGDELETSGINESESNEEDELDTEMKELEELTLKELTEQTKEDTEREQNEYIEKKDAEWIQPFMNSNHYDVIENEGKGDCFFYALKQGLSRAGIKTSVDELRLKLSENMDEETFKGYRKLYNEIKSEHDDIIFKMKQLVKENKELKSRLETSKEKNIQLTIIERAKNLSKEYDELKRLKIMNNEILNEFSNMKDLDTLDKFSDFIKTCAFWADTWAISTIERLYNVKIILLSKQGYESGDKDNVLNCGQLNDTILESRGIFEPKYYIMMSYTGDHYELITYKSRGALKFKELPYAVKQLIIFKCMEKNAGPYYIIPDFRQLKGELEMSPEIEEVVEIPPGNIWNDDTIFQYYIKSNPKPLPGKGSGEKMGPEGFKEYAILSSIPEWRRKLDDLWESEFNLDEHKWLSVEHYYQGSKYKNSFPQYYLQFSLDSNSDISKSPSMAKAAGGKSGKFEGKQLRPKNIIVDNNFFGNRQKQVLKEGLMAKFSQNEELKTILLSTKKAKLTRYLQGSPSITSNELMEVRYELTK